MSAVLVFVAVLLLASDRAQEEPVEFSGLVRDGEYLLLVSDEADARWFRWRPPVPASAGESPVGTFIVELSELSAVELRKAGAARDLESIACLGDGRPVVLSENAHALFDVDGVVATLSPEFQELGSRGLEGLAVRAGLDRSSHVAALWEGGYYEFDKLTRETRDALGWRAPRPVLIEFTLAAGARGVVVAPEAETRRVELRVPEPEGRQPEAQRFQAPDLVWHERAGEEPLFILLLSSSDAPRTRKKHSAHTWLQRFGRNGHPLGDPFDLALAPGYFAANWEGLAWWEPGRTLVLLNDEKRPGETRVLFVDVPRSWL